MYRVPTGVCVMNILLFVYFGSLSQVQRLSWFANWFDSLEDPPTAIIDGPNAGYMGQNFPEGGFSVSQARAFSLPSLFLSPLSLSLRLSHTSLTHPVRLQRRFCLSFDSSQYVRQRDLSARRRVVTLLLSLSLDSADRSPVSLVELSRGCGRLAKWWFRPAPCVHPPVLFRKYRVGSIPAWNLIFLYTVVAARS